MNKTRYSYFAALALSTALLLPGPGMAAQSDQGGKQQKEAGPAIKQDKDLNKVEQKKSLHAERKAAAKRFKQAQESAKVKGANKK